MFDSSWRLLIFSPIKLFLLSIYFLSIFNQSTAAVLAQSKDRLPEDADVSETQVSKIAEIQIFCSTILDIENVRQILPEFKIDRRSRKQKPTKTKSDRSSLLTSCPQQVIIIRSSKEEILTEESKQHIIRQITKLYIDKGYINSRPIPLDSTKNNIAKIIIDEGKVDVVVEGTKRLKNYVRSRIELATNPLNTKKLEDQLRLLKNDPLFKNIEATLQPGEQTDRTQLKVRVTEARPIAGGINFDNYSPPSVGGERLGLGLAYRNLAGLGDEIAVAYNPRLDNFSTYNLDFSYRIPINAMNGTISLQTSINRNQVIQGDFAALDIEGESERYAIDYRQPLTRNPREEFALSVSFDYQNGQTFTFQSPTPFGFGPDEDGISRTSVLSFGTEYTKRDMAGAWGWRNKLRWGVGIFDATDNESPTPDGKFVSFLTQLQRLQVVSKSNFFILQGDLQITPNTLLPSEQFSIGGGQSVRGYRQNIRAGDNGIRFSLEDRQTLVSNSRGDAVFVFAPFVDLGFVWQISKNPNTIPDKQFIAGAGLGLLLQPMKGLNLRLDYGVPIIDLEDKGDDIQDDGLYFTAGYSF